MNYTIVLFCAALLAGSPAAAQRLQQVPPRGPYPAAGWRPEGPAFEETESAPPGREYGAPQAPVEPDSADARTARFRAQQVGRLRSVARLEAPGASYPAAGLAPEGSPFEEAPAMQVSLEYGAPGSLPEEDLSESDLFEEHTAPTAVEPEAETLSPGRSARLRARPQAVNPRRLRSRLA